MMVSIRLIQYNMPLLKESALQSFRVLFYSYPSSKSRRRKRTRALKMLFSLDKWSIFYPRDTQKAFWTRHHETNRYQGNMLTTRRSSDLVVRHVGYVYQMSTGVRFGRFKTVGGSWRKKKKDSFTRSRRRAIMCSVGKVEIGRAHK